MQSFLTRSLVIGGLVITMCYSSCTYKQGDVPSPIVSTPAVVSYANDIKPILVTYCLGVGTQHCHVTASNQEVLTEIMPTTYEGLKAKVSNGSLQARVFTPGGGMPPNYSTGPQV